MDFTKWEKMLNQDRDKLDFDLMKAEKTAKDAQRNRDMLEGAISLLNAMKAEMPDESKEE